MKLNRIISLKIILSIISSATLFAQTETDYGPTEILFLGSSYFNYHNLPQIFNQLTSDSKDVYIDYVMPNGICLQDHVEGYVSNAKINERNWDFIVLQGVGGLITHLDYFPNYDPVYPALQSLKKIIHDNCPSTRIIFCLPWAFEDGMTWVGLSDTYEDMQIMIYNKTLEYSESLDITIAPVGWAWYKILEEQNYPLHYLHMSDWNHPSLKGSFVMACVIYSTLFLESSINNPHYVGIDNTETDYLKEISSNTVLEDLELWKITPYIDTTLSNITTTGAIYRSHKPKLNLYQNYPNPCSKETNIRYQLPAKTKVELAVYDLTGNKKIIVINKVQLPGNYQIKLHINTLKEGTYILRLKTDYGMLSNMLQIIK